MTDQLNPHQRISGEEREKLRDEIVQKYLAGATIRTLADEYGRSYGFVHRVLAEAEVELRGRGGNTRKRTTGLSRTQQREYAQRLAQHKIRKR